MEEPTELFEYSAIEGDLQLNMDTIRLIPCPHTDIITEFADVEIFLISVDSLLLELCAHDYHNWTLGGQTIVISEQVKRLLGSLEDLNAKFKLVVFSEMATLFQKDDYLRFLHPFLLAFLSTSKWALNIEIFQSPLDERWNDFLHQLTPSFMLMSLENLPEKIYRSDADFANRFISIAFHLINESIPVVFFNGFTINFTSVMAFRLSTVPLNIDNFQKKIANIWSTTQQKGSDINQNRMDIVKSLSECKNAADFWAIVVKEILLQAKDNSMQEFENFSIAAILSSLVCSKIGQLRRYPEADEEGGKMPSPAYNRMILAKAGELLTIDTKCIQFPIEDLWDGRMVLNIYRQIIDRIEAINPSWEILAPISKPTEQSPNQDKNQLKEKPTGMTDKKWRELLEKQKKRDKQQQYRPKPKGHKKTNELKANQEENNSTEDKENQAPINGHQESAEGEMRQWDEDQNSPDQNKQSPKQNGQIEENPLTQVLPLRLQEEFAKLHSAAGLKTAIPTDLTEKLLDPLTPSENPSQQSRLAKCQLYTVRNDLMAKYIPELQSIIETQPNCLSKHETNYANLFKNQLQWRFKQIEDPLISRDDKAREEIKRAMANPRDAKRLDRQRQTLSKWYQLFSDSLEGQGGQLLVDFSRVVKMPAITENGKDDEDREKQEKKTGGPTAKKEKKVAKGSGGGGGKPGAGGLSKKDMILKQNRDAMIKQQVESDKTKIEFATRLKTKEKASELDNLMRKLELNESKALCTYQKMLHYAEAFAEQNPKFESKDQKREAALGLVESLKSLFVKYHQYLDEQQMERVLFYWASLGFGRPDSVKRRDKQYDLDIDLVYYQLKYGGRMIDVLSDPCKDERVTGFHPDAWQRRMLDAVDQDKSALIVAPTSAGKTFVSYYCIEKVLRKSNDDVVVYISPSKALTNQIVGSVYARFRGKAMSTGKVLYGIFNNEIVDNVLNCQVLVTIPDCFEQILLSTSPRCQAFVSRIKYVILDEVHCINQKDTQGQSLGHIWEHIFLLIRCPFLALSATISNIQTLRDWLQTAEQVKPMEGTLERKVEMITYDERWSELELALQRIRDCPKGLQFENDEEQFMRGSSVTSNYAESGSDENGEMENDQDRTITPTPLQQQPQEKIPEELVLKSSKQIPNTLAADTIARSHSPARSDISRRSSASSWRDVTQYFNPFAVYKLEKLRMFGIPADQRLTARQILELYEMMSDVDPDIKEDFEPTKYFKQYKQSSSAIGKDSTSLDSNSIWLNRTDLRKLETSLKDRFVKWMNEDKTKIDKIFVRLETEVKNEFEKRSKPFNMRNSALFNIMPLMDQLKNKDQIPALCFNDDREMCEHLAIRVFNEMQKREDTYKMSVEFKRKFNFKEEEKAQKLAKRKRDEEEKAAKRKGKRTDEDGKTQRHEKADEQDSQGVDLFAEMKIELNKELSRFKLLGNWSDEDIYNKCVENLGRRLDRHSTKTLLRLFERGIGFHHDGLSNAERSAVEVLFRRGFLGIVFSTSTLALGMNLPCKTVIFGVDTPKLTPLQFRQMSGRAGRRGFDPAGTVIFMSLPTSKIRRLLTASLATLRGNVPITTVYLLQLFAYINGQKEVQGPKDQPQQQQTKSGGTKGSKSGGGGGKQHPAIDTNDVQNEEVRKKAALTLLQVPFVLKTRNEHTNGTFANLLKFLTLFNVQLLRRMQLIDENCIPRGFAQFAVHLGQYEPGNLIFIQLLQEGALHRYIKKYDLTHPEQREQAKDDIVCILAHLFTQKLVSIHLFNEKNGPFLPPLHEEIESCIMAHNAAVDQLLLACLQLSSVNQRVENSVLALSGCTEKCIQFSSGQVNFVPVLDSDFQLDERIIPMVQMQKMDHRGRKIQKNSYAFDFWRNPDKNALCTRNGLSIAERWYLLNDFNRVLNAIAGGLKEIAYSKDDLYKLIVHDDITGRTGIAEEFDDKFRIEFKMRRKEGMV